MFRGAGAFSGRLCTRRTSKPDVVPAASAVPCSATSATSASATVSAARRRGFAFSSPVVPAPTRSPPASVWRGKVQRGGLFSRQQRLRPRPELRHPADPAIGALRLADDELVHLEVRQDEEAVLLEALEDPRRGSLGREDVAAADHRARLGGVAA